MKISYDPRKRQRTLDERGLDFDDAAEIFAGQTADAIDDRTDYGEVRWQTYGVLRGRLINLVWTARGEIRHVISMRKCNEREQREFGEELGRRRQ